MTQPTLLLKMKKTRVQMKTIILSLLLTLTHSRSDPKCLGKRFLCDDYQSFFKASTETLNSDGNPTYQIYNFRFLYSKLHCSQHKGEQIEVITILMTFPLLGLYIGSIECLLP